MAVGPGTLFPAPGPPLDGPLQLEQGDSITDRYGATIAPGGGGGGTPATTVTGPDAYGDPAAVGVGTDYARDDHDHGLPAAPPIADVLDSGNSAGGVPIHDVDDPLDPQDVATKAYVDATVGGGGLAAVLTISNDAGGFNIANLAFDGPTDPLDAASVAYVLSVIPAPAGLGAVLAISDDAGASPIANLTDPTNPQDAATKAYVDGLVVPVGIAAELAAQDLDGTNAAGAVGHYADIGHQHPILPVVRAAAGVPAGAPTGAELPIAFDSTAVTGGVYYWTGAAWVKGGTI